MTDRRITAAEATDRHGRILMWCMLLGSLLFSLNAAERLTTGLAERVLDAGQIVLMAVMVGGLSPIMYWKLTARPKLPESERRAYFARDSYTVEVLRSARTVSWSFTFATLVLSGIAARAFQDVPARFFLDLSAAVMFASFAIAALNASR